MGGGDLNLKKSWHPSTLRNIERVWKAEQKHEVEKQKIEQLQKELAEERAREEIQAFAEDKGVVRKKDERLDWMYQGPAAMVNRDEYLLGRKIDKTLETLQQIEKGGEPSKEEGADIASTMFSSQNLSGTATVDLATKIREDPLFSIMKKEKEERKNLLTNPVKMKQLQQMLKDSLNSSKSKKNKKNKKKKRHDSYSDEEKEEEKQKKHGKSHSTESDEEREYSEVPSKKDLSKKKKNKEYNSSEKRSSKYEYDFSDSGERKYKNSHFSTNDREFNYRPTYPKYPPSTSDYQDSKGRATDRDYYPSERSSKYQYDMPNSSERKHRNPHVSSNNRESSHLSSHPRNYDSTTDNDEPRHKSFHRNGQNSSRNHHSKPFDPKPYSHQEEDTAKADKKRKLDSAEKEHLLKEMQENAKWREDQRKRNTQRYREEDEKEDKNQRVDPSDFLKPMLSKAAGKGSLENRVKQKIFTIQRNSSSMDKNFARRD